MNKMGKTLLLIGASLNIAIALLHIGIVIVGAPAYIYFGTVDLAQLEAQGSALPAIITLMLAVIFVVCAVYAFAGAGLLRHPPVLRVGLLCIGFVYTLRGLIVILDLMRLSVGADYPFRQTVFSAVALLVGLIYLVGTFKQWNDLLPKAKITYQGTK